MQVFFSALTAAAATSGALAGALHRGVTSPQSELLAPSVYEGERTRRAIALTFDDGPSEATPMLLDLLAEHDVRATFFQCGLNVRRLPAIARRVHAEGHEIGNHTFTHARLCPRIGFQLNLRSAQNIYEELAGTQRAIAEEVGVTPRFFRPPYGFRWFGLRAAQRRLNLLGVIWTVIARDWELPAAGIASVMTEGAAPGGILCLHDGRDIRPNPDVTEMLKALRLALPLLKARGFRFETVGQLTHAAEAGTRFDLPAESL